MSFKNALCLDAPPGSGGGWMSGYWHRCHRHKDHKPPHRSRSFEWNDGDHEAHPRTDRKDAE